MANSKDWLRALGAGLSTAGVLGQAKQATQREDMRLSQERELAMEDIASRERVAKLDYDAAMAKAEAVREAAIAQLESNEKIAGINASASAGSDRARVEAANIAAQAQIDAVRAGRTATDDLVPEEESTTTTDELGNPVKSSRTRWTLPPDAPVNAGPEVIKEILGTTGGSAPPPPGGPAQTRGLVRSDLGLSTPVGETPEELLKQARSADPAERRSALAQLQRMTEQMERTR